MQAIYYTLKFWILPWLFFFAYQKIAADYAFKYSFQTMSVAENIFLQMTNLTKPQIPWMNLE